MRFQTLSQPKDDDEEEEEEEKPAVAKEAKENAKTMNICIQSIGPAVAGYLPCVPLLAEGYLAKGVRVIDGDTTKSGNPDCLPWDVALTNQRIRIADFDAWEASLIEDEAVNVTVTEAEVKKGKRATEELKELVAEAQVFVIPFKKRSRDVYGRISGNHRNTKRQSNDSVD